MNVYALQTFNRSINSRCQIIIVSTKSAGNALVNTNTHCQAMVTVKHGQTNRYRTDTMFMLLLISLSYVSHAIWCQPIDCSLVSDAGHHQTWYVGSPRDNVRQRLVFSTCTYVTVRQCAVCRRHHSGLVLGKNNWAETKCQETSKPSGRKNGRDGRSMLIKATWYIMPKWLD